MLSREEAIKRFEYDRDRFGKLLLEFDKHFVNPGRAARGKMLVLDLNRLVQETVVYKDEVIDTSALFHCLPDNQHDKQLFHDLMMLIFEYFRRDPASLGTLNKFRDCTVFFMGLLGF